MNREQRIKVNNNIDISKLHYSDKIENIRVTLTEYDKLSFGIGLTFVYDLAKHCFFYISSGSEMISKRKNAYTPNQGYKTLLDNIHPDDIEYFIKVKNHLTKFLYSLSDKQEKLGYRATVKLRLLKDRNKFFAYYIQAKVIELDTAGNAWLIMGKCVHTTEYESRFPLVISSVNENSLTIFDANNFERIIPKPQLTNKQKAVLKLLAANKSVGEIAEHLNITSAMVRRHQTEVMKKLYAHSRSSLIENAKILNLYYDNASLNKN